MSEASSKSGTPALRQIASERIRHTISAGLSFINASVENLATSKPDLAHALRMYSVGAGKIKLAIAELDRSKTSTNASDLGYSGTHEEQFTGDNAEVTKWTTHFQRCVSDLKIFPGFEAQCPTSKERAVVVASLWYRFSSFMPWFLCQAAAKVSTNEKRHYVIQTAYEELGMRDVREIHPDMFWDAAKVSGVSIAEREEILSDGEAASVLESLRKLLLSYRTDEEVLGILLGLEIPAMENIETLFLSLSHTAELRLDLDRHKFFQLHRQIESEHVRLTVANFLRFCSTEKQKDSFSRGFSDGLKFWTLFWSSTASIVARKKANPEVFT